LSLCLTTYYEDVLARRGKAPYTFLILELNGDEQSYSCSSHCNPEERIPDPHSTEGWVANRWFGKEYIYNPHMKKMRTEQVHCHVHTKPTIKL
jgi:hypothetical protein